MAKRKNSIKLDDIEQGYNIIKKYWRVLRNNSTSPNNSINYINSKYKNSKPSRSICNRKTW